MPSRMNAKLAEMIRQRAAHVILYELKDPRMGFVTITRVKLTRDLSMATIYWSVIGGNSERSKTSHALDHAKLFVQRRVAEGLRTRIAPQVSFEYDESVEGTIRMGGLLKQLRQDRGDAAPSDAASPDAEGSGDQSSKGESAEDESAEDESDEDESDESDEDEPDEEESTEDARGEDDSDDVPSESDEGDRGGRDARA